MRKALVFTACLSLALPLLAADAKPGAANGKFVQEFLKHWKTSKEFTIAVAEKMPEASYGFKPNAEEMSFGELMAHIAGGNAYLLAGVTGTKPAVEKPANMEKATIIKLLGDSFDMVTQAVEGMTDEQLDKTYKLEGEEMTGREGLLAALTHVAHHRGQAEVYLRVKNIKPPDYQF